MTTQDNTIKIDNEKRSFVFYHVNRLLIVALSTIALAFDGYQIPDVYYGASIVIWLWLPEIEVLERKMTRHKIKQFSITLLSAFMMIAIYIGLGKIMPLIQWQPGFAIWLLLCIIGVGSLFLLYKTIILLVMNNPIQNIGKAFKSEAELRQ